MKWGWSDYGTYSYAAKPYSCLQVWVKTFNNEKLFNCGDRQGSFGSMPELPWRSRHFLAYNQIFQQSNKLRNFVASMPRTILINCFLLTRAWGLAGQLSKPLIVSFLANNGWLGLQSIKNWLPDLNWLVNRIPGYNTFSSPASWSGLFSSYSVMDATLNK